jgi:Alginate lyase
MHISSRRTRPCLFLLIVLLLIIAGLPVQPAPAHALPGLPGAARQTIYLPVVLRASEPLGLIVTPAELRSTRALADQGQDPSAKAVRVLLRRAADDMAFQPCAMAVYTTDTGEDCLNQSAHYTLVLALAYYMTDDPAYANKAAAIIRSWYTTLVSIDATDKQTQLDWSRWMPAMIWGADLLEGTPGWTRADRQRFSAMLVKVLPKGQQAAEKTDNWADAGNVLRLTIALYADLPAERAAATASWKLKIDGIQASSGWSYGMLGDGSLADENRRGVDGLRYNQVALSSKTVFAEITRRRGDGSLYSYKTPRGVGLKNGWDFLASHVVSARQGVCNWPYTADKCVDYSNKSGWELAYAYWRNPAYLGPIGLARPYGWSDWSDPSYSTLLFSNLSIQHEDVP